LRMARRISRTSFSAGTRLVGAEHFWLIFTLLGVTMSHRPPRISNHHFGHIGAEAGHLGLVRRPPSVLARRMVNKKAGPWTVDLWIKKEH
jgi:hypothetical protein